MKQGIFLFLIFLIASISGFAQEKEVPKEKPLIHGGKRGGVMLGKAIRLQNPVPPPCVCKISSSKRLSSEFIVNNYRNVESAVRCSCQASRINSVLVQFTVDKEGNVESAEAISGHPLLRPASVNAILNSKFSVSRINSVPVKAVGIITYEFILQKDKWKPRYVSYKLNFEND